MDFSRAEVHPEPIFSGAALLIFAAYVVAVVCAGRRFGAPGLWAVWIAGIVAGNLFPFLMHGESISHLDVSSILFQTVVMGVPMGISAWAIAWSMRRPRPVGIPDQLMLSVMAFILTFVLVAMVAFAVIGYTVSRRYPL